VRQAAALNATWKAADAPAVPLGPVAAPGPRAPRDGGGGDDDGDDDGDLGLDADAAESRAWLGAVSAVWASPLTRALQTAQIAFHGLEAMTEVEAHPSVREVKGVGGLDCVGLAVGADAMAARCRDALEAALVDGADGGSAATSGVAREAAALSSAAHAASVLAATPIAARDAAAEWWTAVDAYETADAAAQRADEFWREVQVASAGGATVAVAGHSLFFRGLFERYLDETRVGRVQNIRAAPSSRRDGIPVGTRRTTPRPHARSGGASSGTARSWASR